jgi:hypothetical protein
LKTSRLSPPMLNGVAAVNARLNWGAVKCGGGRLERRLCCEKWFTSGRVVVRPQISEARQWGAERAESAATAGALQLRILAWGQA